MMPVFVAQSGALARVPLGAATSSDEAATEELLSEAVFLSSRRVVVDGDRLPRGIEAACTRRSYLIRLRSRTTPLGVFAGVAPARFRDGTAVLRLEDEHRTRTTPSAAWLTAVADRSLEEPYVLRRLTLHTNNLLTRRGRRYHCERPGDLSRAVPHATSVRATEATAFIVEAARGGAAAAEVIDALRRKWPQVPAPVIDQAVVALIRAGVLLHDLLPEDPRDEPLGHLRDRLPHCSPWLTPLADLRTLLATADTYTPGHALRRRSLSAARDLADRILSCERPLRADTVVGATVELPMPLAREAAEAAGVLWSIGWGSPPLRGYHETFRRRYGINRAVPLLEATDQVIGIGCAPGVAGIGPAEADPRRDAVLARMLSTAAAHGRTEITLDADTVAELRAPRGDVPPRSAEIYVRLCGSADDGISLALCPSGGSQDAGSTAGRFAPLLPGVFDVPTADQEGGVVAEVVFRSRTADTRTVAAESGFAAHRIPLGVPTRPGDLMPEELLLVSTGKRLYLWSAQLSCEVVPVVYSRVAPGLLPPLVRLLSLVGQGDARPWHGWTWRQSVPFQPAVRYRRVLLAPARWLLPPELTRAVHSTAAWDAALTAWRTSTRPAPPRTVVTDDGDRQLPLDLDHPQDRELLRRYTRRGLQAVTAPLCDDRQAVLPGPGGHHWADLAISLRRAKPERSAASPVPFPPRPADSGWYLPGSRWLSLSLQAPAEHHDAILLTLPKVLAEAAAPIDRWFWLRYHDTAHGPHVRIRFNGEPGVLGGQVLPVMAAWGADLRWQRLSVGFSVDPYEQEIERYGGADAIGAAEDIFCADSALVLAALAHTDNPDDHLVIAALSAVAIARSLLDAPLSALGRHGLDRAARRLASSIRPRVRTVDHPTAPVLPDPLRRPWGIRTRALTCYRGVLAPEQRRTCASDLIHMHCNRLVPGAERERLARSLAADLLAVRPTRASDARSEAQ